MATGYNVAISITITISITIIINKILLLDGIDFVQPQLATAAIIGGKLVILFGFVVVFVADVLINVFIIVGININAVVVIVVIVCVAITNQLNPLLYLLPLHYYTIPPLQLLASPP